MKHIYGLLGRDIGYSFSRGYFAEKFQKEKLNFEYNNFDISQINEVSEILNNSEIKGLNVTIPYKEEVISFLNNLDPIAKEIGAVNTIKFDNNRKTTGYNSDFYGFIESLKPLLKTSTKNALILGTGGASKAIAYALTQLQIDYTFVSRTAGDRKIAYADLNEDIIKKNTLLINCTPLGTHPDVGEYPDIPYKHITEEHILYDLIYNPAETVFLKKGREKGAKTCNGLQMLALQAEKSWEIWNL